MLLERSAGDGIYPGNVQIVGVIMTTFAGQLTTVITRDQADLGLTHTRYLTPQSTLEYPNSAFRSRFLVL